MGVDVLCRSARKRKADLILFWTFVVVHVRFSACGTSQDAATIMVSILMATDEIMLLMILMPWALVNLIVPQLD